MGEVTEGELGILSVYEVSPLTAGGGDGDGETLVSSTSSFEEKLREEYDRLGIIGFSCVDLFVGFTISSSSFMYDMMPDKTSSLSLSVLLLLYLELRNFLNDVVEDELFDGLGCWLSKDSFRLGVGSSSYCMGSASGCTCLLRFSWRLVADPMSGIVPGKINSPKPVLEPN
jgi:hypothetical protein